MKTIILALALTLTGCATCRHHQMACAIASTVIVGSVALSLDSGGNHGPYLVARSNFGKTYQPRH